MVTSIRSGRTCICSITRGCSDTDSASQASESFDIEVVLRFPDEVKPPEVKPPEVKFLTMRCESQSLLHQLVDTFSPVSASVSVMTSVVRSGEKA